jgi:hypothetical protein
MPIDDLQPVKDSYISDANPSSNFGNLSSMLMGWFTSPDEAARALFHFDLSQLGGATTITSAVLHLWIDQMFVTQSLGETGRIRRITTPGWVEDEVTWDDANVSVPWTTRGGDFTSTDQTTFALNDWGPAPQERTEIVTTLAQDAIDNRFDQLHLIIMKDPESGNEYAAQIESSEDLSHVQPFLRVDHNGTGVGTRRVITSVFG